MGRARTSVCAKPPVVVVVVKSGSTLAVGHLNRLGTYG